MFTEAFIRDAAERVGWTAVQAFVATLAVSGFSFNWEQAAAAGVAAALAAVKAIVKGRAVV